MEIQLQKYTGAQGSAFTHVAGQPRHLPGRHSSLDAIELSLAQSADPGLPLPDRLRHLCLVSSSLDEFFEVRIASLLAQKRKGSGAIVIEAEVAATLAQCRRIIEHQYAVLRQAILPGLSAAGIRLLRPDQFHPAQRAWTRHYFMREIRPLLTPIGLDPAHPFPQVSTKALNFIVELGGRDAFGRGSRIAIMRAPRVLARVIRMPVRLPEQRGNSYCLLSSIIQAHIAELFPGREVLACSQFRLTRNSERAPSEDASTQLPGALPGELRRRLYGLPVRLEIDAGCPGHLAGLLLDQFSLPRDRLFAVDGPVNLVHLLELDEEGARDLSAAQASAATPVAAGETKQLSEDEHATMPS